MKHTILLFLALTISGPAMSQTGDGDWIAKQSEWEASRSPQHKALLKCFQDAPWVVPADYYDKCMAAKKLSDVPKEGAKP